MNFEQIKSFISIAKSGSYSQAAKQRFISQPAISNQIKSLEEELGTTLLVRTGKNIVLTEQGKAFYKYANQLVSIEKDIFNCVKEDNAHYGIMNIGAPYLSVYELMENFVVRAVSEKEKEVTYRILQREDTDIPNMVLSGELEIGVANHRLEHKDLVYEEAFTEEIVLITPNEKKYRNLTSEQIKELLLTDKHIRYDFGNGSDFLWNDFFGKIIGEDLHNIRTAARIENYLHQLALVEAGLGIGFISNICMQKRWKEGRVLAYRCPGLLQKTHYVVYSKERSERSELIRDTKDMLIEELRKSIQNPEIEF